MTNQENFLRMMKGKQPRCLPLDLPLTPPVWELVREKTGGKGFATDFWGLFPHYPPETGQWEAAYGRLGVKLPAPRSIDAFGVTHFIPPKETLGKAWHLQEFFFPLAEIKSVKELESLPWPASKPEYFAWFGGEMQKIRAAGRVAVGHMACTVFESSWYLRGMENLFYDLVEENEVGQWLLDFFTERSEQAVVEYCKAGVDVICLGDDVGTQKAMMMSVEMWRKIFKPRLKKIIDAIRRARPEKVWVFYHSDGNIEAIIPELIEIGVDILNPMQPECMDAGKIIKQYKDRLAFWGLIGTQTTMPFGTPDDVRQVVAQCGQWAREGARIVVAPTHVLEPDVPWANIAALVEAVRGTKL